MISITADTRSRSRLQQDREKNLEIAAANSKPKLPTIMEELEVSQPGFHTYFGSQALAYRLWHSVWDGQCADGRKWSELLQDGSSAFPWEGASDTRVRLCEKLVQQHVTVAKYAIMNAKVQAISTRPAVDAIEAQQATTILKWMLNTQQREELQRELPLALAWRFGLGASAIAVDWEQARRVDYVPINLPDMADYLQTVAAGQSENPEEQMFMVRIMETIMDPAYDETYIGLLQQMSPIVTRRQARKLLMQLRTERSCQVPVPYVFKSKPRMVALRLGVDLLFPPETSDINTARWTDWIERVTETELSDRIETDDYNEDFVAEAVRHKGETWAGPGHGYAGLIQQTLLDRGQHSGIATSPSADEFRNHIELHHVRYYALMEGVPCLYLTTFCPAAVGPKRDAPYYARHGLDKNPHGEYPFVILRNELNERSILSSRGIPVQAYNWENEIKAQRDGRTDLTSLTLRPPLIVPHSREKAITGTPLPGSVLGVSRPSEIQFMNPPQQTNASTEIERIIHHSAAEHFGLFDSLGMAIDPDWKNLRRGELAGDVLGEFTLVLSLEFKLMRFFMTDEEVAQVVGNLVQPFHADKKAILGEHRISVAFDPREIDKDYLETLFRMIDETIVSDSAGVIDHAKLTRWKMATINPDLATEVVSDVQTATNREIQNEREAVSRIVGSGIPEAFPETGNFQARLQAMMEALQENPALQGRLQQEPDKLQVLANRMEYYKNQLQQRENAIIGKRQVTRPFDKRAPMVQAPALTQ